MNQLNFAGKMQEQEKNPIPNRAKITRIKEIC
jgi:hypothetical protein